MNIPYDLREIAASPWPSFAKSASLDESGARYYSDNPSVGDYSHPQYLHARHVLGLDDELKDDSNMHPDLKWLAENVSEWPKDAYWGAWLTSRTGQQETTGFHGWPKSLPPKYHTAYTRAQWLQARQDLGLVMTEEEAELPAEEHRNKYMREIKPGVWVDVYDVLHAWRVQNPALQHLIKKALQPGERGHKTMEQDMDDIVASALRARELEK